MKTKTLSIIGAAALLTATTFAYGVAGSTSKTVEFANYTSLPQNITLKITAGNITGVSAITGWSDSYLTGVYSAGNIYSVRSGQILPGQQVQKNVTLKGQVSGKGDVVTIMSLDYSTSRGLSGNTMKATGAPGTYEAMGAVSGPCRGNYNTTSGIYVQIAPTYGKNAPMVITSVTGNSIASSQFPQ